MTDEAFDQVLAPLGREHFFAKHWGCLPLHAQGSAGRFTHLLAWNELNRILENVPLAPPRIRLVRGSKDVRTENYLEGEPTRARINVGALTSCLSQGATLIINCVDELVPAIGDMCGSFSKVLGARVTTNLYASWSAESGFDLHWDPQDTMILQLSGNKRWQVHPPTRVHPLRESTIDPPKPSGPPTIDAVLADGDVLYLPRGWWHVGSALAGPSLHLTVTIVPPNGVDFLRWMTLRLQAHAAVRGNLPRVAGEQCLALHMQELRCLLNETWDEAAPAQFLRAWDASLPVTRRLDLPHSPLMQMAALTEASSIRLAGQAALEFFTDPEINTTCFRAGGRWWSCVPNLEPALADLSGELNVKVGDLSRRLSDTQAVRNLRMLLMAMAMAGVVVVDGTD